MTKTSKLFIIVLIAIAAGAIIIAAVLIPRRGGYHIKSLLQGDITIAKPRDYEKSRLNLYNNGTFDVEIIYLDEEVFVAIGTYKKEDNKYKFYYIDCYTTETIGDDIQTEKNLNYVNHFFIYETKKEQIRFVDHLERVYYFG